MSVILANESGLQNPELSILFVDDNEIAVLNEKYLNRQGPTDVISFPMMDGSYPEVSPALLGDVVISVETAARQAAERGTDLLTELTLLLTHGILHLLGYDHEGSAEERRRMEEKERDILSGISS